MDKIDLSKNNNDVCEGGVRVVDTCTTKICLQQEVPSTSSPCFRHFYPRNDHWTYMSTTHV